MVIFIVSNPSPLVAYVPMLLCSLLVICCRRSPEHFECMCTNVCLHIDGAVIGSDVCYD